jgi:hypothetical protein
MKKITSKKLLNYGAMSAAILGVASANGQIVFTDIDDVAMSPGDPAVNIDFDENGSIDFSLQNFDATGGAGAVIFPGVNGSTVSNSFVGFANGNFQYPSNLAEGDVIDATASTTAAATRADLNFYSCAYSGSQFCGGNTDAYIGLVFNLDGASHYGWVKIDLTADATTYTVKSYAFNSVAGEAISAGQTLSLEDNKIEGFSSYVSNDVLTLNARTPMESLTIHNISGQELISRKLSNSTELIDLSALSTGVYIATVSVEGKLQAIKFVR